MCEFSEIKSLPSTFMFLFLRKRNSSTSASGSITTPFPITHFFPGYKIPLGTRCSIYSFPSKTTVCPALFPP